MGFLSNFNRKKTPLRRKLFLYMLAIAGIVLCSIATGLFFIDNFSSTKKTVAKDLSVQADGFYRQVDKYYDDLTMMGTALSSDVGKLVDGYLNQKGITFSDVNDSFENVEGLQRAIIPKLKEELLKTDCSGAFVIFNATVNTTLENSDHSKTGLYFQRSTLDPTDESILLYRGISELGRENGVMPHRKWRLEFQIDLIPDLASIPTATALPVEKSAYLINAFTLPGTSERAMLFVIPIVSFDGVLYGYCGFETNESYFKKFFEQTTQISHLTCTLTKRQDSGIDYDAGFSTDIYNGYYLQPKGKAEISNFGEGLVRLNSKDSSYVGVSKQINICQCEYLITAMIPNSWYTRTATENTVRIILTLSLLLSVITVVCIYFTRKFLAPLLKGLEQIHRREHKNSSSTIVEINDLFAFLTEQDKLREEEADVLMKRQEEQNDALRKANQEIERLSYSRKTEVDPDNYETFKSGIKSLTKTEKAIFSLYLEGKSATEILDICKIQQSTLKYHNHNILEKLGVSSRKQMLRYAALLKQENGDVLL